MWRSPRPAWLCLFWLWPGLALAASVTVKGSDTMVILVQRWAEAFMKEHPQARIQVTGGGTGTGIASLLNGSTDIAMASRAMKPAEQKQLQSLTGRVATETAVARDGVTFFVHAQNPLEALSLAQLRDLYLGDLQRWSQVGGPDKRVVLYARENSSGTYVFVKDHLLQGEDFSSRAQTLPGTAAVAHAVSQEKWGIGFGGAAYAKGIKELKIREGGRDIAPVAANFKNRSYPLARDLFFYTREPPTGALKAFIDFALSEQGQAIVTRVGYFPLN